jgi:hypothetical protein
LIEIQINIPAQTDISDLEGIVENAVRNIGLVVTMKCSLSKYPGCVHWHLKQGREKGTLELTFWPAHRRLWFKIQDARKADWIEPMMQRLKKCIEEELKL